MNSLKIFISTRDAQRMPKKRGEGVGYIVSSAWGAMGLGRSGFASRKEQLIHPEGSRNTRILTYCYQIGCL